jgi:molybdopterin/thiamine biosynthesis adenylyltransferase
MQIDRSRHSGIVTAERLNTTALIIGAGAIGSQVAQMLAQLGVTHFGIMDFDEVDDTNCSAQAFRAQDIGNLKVEALAGRLCLDYGANVLPIAARFVDEFPMEAAHVFICVDTMAARKAIVEAAELNTEVLFVYEARMGGRQGEVTVINMSSKESIAAWKRHYFPDDRAADPPCTEKATVFNAAAIAAWMLALFTSAVNEEDAPRRIAIQMYGADMGAMPIEEQS